MILHTINKVSALEKCRSLVSPDDVVVLIEDGVSLALTQLPFDVLVLGPDLQARGLSSSVSAAQTIDYAKLVSLTDQADKVMAWF